MRDRLFILAAGATLVMAVPSFAQMASMNGPGSSIDSASHSQNVPDDGRLPPDYVKKLTALSYKILAVRSQDGGKLSPQHLASLQHELSQLKREYRIGGGLRVSAG